MNQSEGCFSFMASPGVATEARVKCEEQQERERQP